MAEKDPKAILVQQVPLASPNQTQVSCGYIGPNRVSKTQIGNGKYSLAKRSNVPFVELVGAGGYSKVISWGETAEVAAKTLVSVKNVSFHGGDVWLNRGADADNQPSAITVPVQCSAVLFPGFATQFLVPAYPCDTRGAKRAYVSIDAYRDPTGTGSPVMNIRLRRLDGSMQTGNQLGLYTAPYGPGTGMLTSFLIGASVPLVDIPLGFEAVWGDDTRPHTLLDCSDFFIRTPTSWAADFNWPISVPPITPTGTLDIPGAWYTVEYA